MAKELALRKGGGGWLVRGLGAAQGWGENTSRWEDSTDILMVEATDVLPVDDTIETDILLVEVTDVLVEALGDTDIRTIDVACNIFIIATLP